MLEVAAIGVPDERSGEAVKVFVVRKDPNLTAEALIAFCRENLTGYKVPHHVEFRDELPKSNVGRSCAASCGEVSAREGGRRLPRRGPARGIARDFLVRCSFS